MGHVRVYMPSYSYKQIYGVVKLSVITQNRGDLRENLLPVYGHGSVCSTSSILIENNPKFGVPKIICLNMIGN